MHIDDLVVDAVARALEPVLRELAALRSTLATLAAPTPVGRLLTVAEAARLAGVSQRTVRSWIASGRVRSQVVGSRSRRIPEDGLRDFLAADRENTIDREAARIVARELGLSEGVPKHHLSPESTEQHR